MLATYASAVLVCAASLLVGRALLSLAGQPRWTWLEPPVGFAALLCATGLPARGPGHATTSALALVLLIAAAAVVVFVAPGRGGDAAGDRRRNEEEEPPVRRGAAGGERDILIWGLLVAVAAAVVLSIPFAVSGRWGILGTGFNNDLGLHLAWAEWLRSGFGPAPEAGYPLGPHALADAVAAVPGIGLGQAFVGEILAIGILTALTALAALPGLGPVRRVLAAVFVMASYLGASYYTQGAFKETAEALFVLGVAVMLRNPPPLPAGFLARLRYALPYLAIAGGVLFVYSFAGLAWPIAVAAFWSLTVPAVRRALAPRSLVRFLLRPLTLICLAILAGLAVLTLVGPFGFGAGFNKIAGSNTYGPVSPVETLGVWWASNYRLDAPGEAGLPWLAGAIGGAALVAGMIWWARRRDLSVPIGLVACAVLYFASLPFTGEYSQAKALMIAAPLAMLVAIRPLVTEFSRRAGWSALAVVFIAGAGYSSFIVLRDGPIGPPGHGSELQSFLPILHGKPVLYSGQDRYAAYELLGADTHVPLVEFPDPAVSPNPEKPFDTGDAYSPIDFDSFTRGTLDRFPYVITGRAAWNSEAPPSYRRVAATPSFILWKRVGKAPEERRVLLEGLNPAALAGCEAPEVRVLLSTRGRAALFPATVLAPKRDWVDGNVLHTGQSASQNLTLPAGRWRLSLQYFSPFDLTLGAGPARPGSPARRIALPAALDGQRPNTISLANDGQFWPAGVVSSDGGRFRFVIEAAEASTLQSLSGYDGTAYIGNLVATRVDRKRTVPLAAACDGWIDWYESPDVP